MNLIRRIFIVLLLTAVTALSIGYAWAGLGLAAIIFVLLGLFWFTAEERGLPGWENITLFLFVVAAAIGFFQGLPGWVLLLTVVASLGAWDLTHFLIRLRAAERVDYETGLGREHLRRLGLVGGLGFLTGLLALTTHARISFWWVALLALLAAIGISRVIAYMRKQTGE